jgi:molybdenum cofactor guanylyltransferase
LAAFGELNPELTVEHVTGLILAGGLGRRMGGLDKGLQSHEGMPLVLQVLQRLRPQVGTVLISANRNTGHYQALAPDALVLPDAVPGYLGPLAGVLTGLIHCASPYLMTVPCDAPHVPLDLAAHLLKPLRENPDFDLSFASTLQEGHDQDQPVFSVLRVRMRESLALYLERGGRAVHQWQAQQRGVRVAFADVRAFANINTTGSQIPGQTPSASSDEA